MNKSSKILIGAIFGIVALLFITLLFSNYINQPTKLTYDQFMYRAGQYSTDQTIGETKWIITDKEDEQIKIIVIDSYTLYGYTAKDIKDLDTATGKFKGNPTYIATSPSFYGADSADSNSVITAWKEHGKTVEFRDPNAGSIWLSIMPYAIMILLGGGAIYLIFRQTQGAGSKTMNFGKTKARVNATVAVRFSDVAGAEEEKQELVEIVEFLKNPKKFSEIGARIPRGVLLVGPPGTGKTLFAKAIAGEAGVPFFSISGSDFVEMFVGVGASRVRDLFESAKHSQPCIIFIDEIDAVGRQRGAGLGGGNDEREQTLNQLLVQMDGFEKNDGIIVIAATNRADILDPALLRPGRFDRQIYVNLPDVRGREAILKVHSRNKPLAPNVNFKIVARMTSGFSGADLENLLNEAAILAARANKKVIGNFELYEGINKVYAGPSKKSKLVTESDKRITAYHESGHAILARLCQNGDPVQEVTIVPRGMAAGYTMTRPDSDDEHMSKGKLEDTICMMLGGRIAEEIVIKDVCTGASNDLERVTKIARKMVAEWGMSEKVGLVTYGSDNPVFIGRDMESHNSYSEKIASLIDDEVHVLIENAHDKGYKMLTENRDILDNMVRLLIEKETIYSDEIDMLMERKPLSEIIEFINEREKHPDSNPLDKYNKKEEAIKAEVEQNTEVKIDDEIVNSSRADTTEDDKNESKNSDDKSKNDESSSDED